MTKVSPFTLVNGRFYCENVLEAIGNYLSGRMGSEVKQINSRAQQYTHGYRTGKHRHGKQ